jgi:hypothetical protein
VIHIPRMYCNAILPVVGLDRVLVFWNSLLQRSPRFAYVAGCTVSAGDLVYDSFLLQIRRLGSLLSVHSSGFRLTWRSFWSLACDPRFESSPRILAHKARIDLVAWWSRPPCPLRPVLFLAALVEMTCFGYPFFKNVSLMCDIYIYIYPYRSF